MALSNSVQDALNEAQSHLRNALAYAARNERPLVCQSISKIMLELESIEKYDQLFDTLESGKSSESDDNPFGNFGFNKKKDGKTLQV